MHHFAFVCVTCDMLAFDGVDFIGLYCRCIGWMWPCIIDHRDWPPRKDLQIWTYTISNIYIAYPGLSNSVLVNLNLMYEKVKHHTIHVIVHN